MNDEPKTAKNYAELARILDIDRRTLTRWRGQFRDAPIPEANGSHDVREWRSFAKRHGLGRQGIALGDQAGDVDGDALETLRRRDLAIRIKEREHRLQALKADYLPVEAVREFYARKADETVQRVRAMVSALPMRLAGLEPPEIQEVCREAIDGFCREMREGCAGDAR